MKTVFAAALVAIIADAKNTSSHKQIAEAYNHHRS